MNNENRIGLNDSVMSIVTKMSDGNPGAMNVIMTLLQPETTEIDPDNTMGGIGVILSLDSIGIYGTDIYVLYNDICDNNLIKFIAIIRSWQLGFITDVLLRDISHRQDYSGKSMIDIEDLYNKVKTQLPAFADLNK